ncbi:sigma-70 family RNA polymerase sigma factor [Aliikangiella sp. IMCC44359]|uniref:sigma-70 family RNA polymerase sigma factor n=1 Tax=Aliikangiella sp. IMCC44359 TaxID=3459125 RepID=UPI00403AB49E
MNNLRNTLQSVVENSECELVVANSDKLTFTKPMKTEVSDEQLMLQYARGDLLAFEQLYKKHKGGLYRYCLRQLTNQAKAEECFQEVWLKLVNSRVNYEPKALFTTYLYRIAQNHVIDIIRKEKKIKQETEFDESEDYSFAEFEDKDIASQLAKEDRSQLLRNQIESLPLEQKTALLLKLDAGLSLEEISNILNCGRETVKSRLRYATEKLKKMLGESL